MPRKRRGSDLSRLSKASRRRKEQRKQILQDKREKEIADMYRRMYGLGQDKGAEQKLYLLDAARNYKQMLKTCSKCRHTANLQKDKRKTEERVPCLTVIKKEAPDLDLDHKTVPKNLLTDDCNQLVDIKVEDEEYSGIEEVDPLADNDQPAESLINFIEVKEEPLDVTVPSDNGEVLSPHEDHFSPLENGSFSCMCHLNHSVAEDMEQMRRAKTTTAQKECRHQQQGGMTEGQKKVRRKNSRAAKGCRQCKLGRMTEEQRKAFRAAEAETKRMRYHLRIESMSQGELKAFHAEAAAARRRCRERQKMNKMDSQMHHTIEITSQGCHQQVRGGKKTGSRRRAAARTQREIQQCQMEVELKEDIEQHAAGAASTERKLHQFSEESDLDAQQRTVMEGTTPENLMVQLLTVGEKEKIRKKLWYSR